jgi:hypothetical protein
MQTSGLRSLPAACTDHILPVPTATSKSAKATATDPISDFFARLAEPGHLATFEHEAATLRFDIPDATDTASSSDLKHRDVRHRDVKHRDVKHRDVRHWHVTVHDGDVTVTRQQIAADAIVRVARPYFERIVTGRLNAQAAILRGLLTCEGSIAALIMFQRCLPGPPGSTGKVPPISSQAVMAQRRPT